MIKARLIPCLLLDGAGLVKTTRFKNPTYIGDPINAIKIFNDKEVDELMILDISATKERREPNYKLIERFACECFMPLAYGGGITNLEQAKILFSLGIEKISIQTSIFNDISFIRKLTENFGSQSILASIDIKKNILGNYKIYSSFTRRYHEKNFKIFIQDVINLGVGEIFLNSVDKDGMMEGMDIDLIKIVSNLVNVPLIACGGVGNLNHIKDGIQAGASAIAAGSFFIFHGPLKGVLISYPNYQDINYLFK
jgi:cyclase